jgi:hypothetical protein
VVWLWAARHNPSALAFWLGRGFQETRHETSSPAGDFVLMLRREDATRPIEGTGSSSSSNGGRGLTQKPGGFGAGGGGGGAKRRGKRGKAKAVACLQLSGGAAAVGHCGGDDAVWGRPEQRLAPAARVRPLFGALTRQLTSARPCGTLSAMRLR